MAMLQKVRILPQERLDLPDFNNIESFICADLKALHKNLWANQNFIFSGFVATGTGTNTISVAVANSSLIVGEDDGTVYIGAPSLSPITSTNLTPAATNYIELSITQDTGGADSRAFWDSTANGGEGAEFSQIVDTFIFLKTEINISTSGFSSDPNKVRICEVDVNGSGVITAIRDSRNLFFRLGRAGDATFDYPWASRTEPSTTQFTGADKDLNNFKNWADAIMTTFKEIKGTTYWYETAPITLGGSFRSTGMSILVGATSSARFSWSGTALSITDDNGTPLDSDVLAYIRLYDSIVNIELTRQQAGAAITIADGEVLWVELPDPLIDFTYDSVGLTANNYRVSARGSVPLDDDTFWLAYREGSRLYLRGLGELEAGEAKQINDETTRSLTLLLGFNPETATSIPYTDFPVVDLPGSFSSSDSLVTAISTNTENINYLSDILNENPYEEVLTVVSGAPANDNEITGPVSIGTSILLPLDSRDSNSTEYYIVGQGELQVYLNGQYLLSGDDWLEVGLSGAASSTIEINIPLVVGDRLVFRNAQAGGLFISGGGGLTSLQDAYNNGNTITTSVGVPFTVGGAASKVAEFNGDITVTGVIDPKGITFTRESSNPLPAGQDGFWVSSIGEIIYYQDGVGSSNISQAVSGEISSSGNSITLENQSGSTISVLTPVRIDNLGYIDVIDVAQEAEALATIGLASEEIIDGVTGKVAVSGIVKNITTSAAYGDVLYVSKAGGLTNIKPSIGVDGFISGDWVIRIGVISRNVTTPSQKDLIINLSIVGQL